MNQFLQNDYFCGLNLGANAIHVPYHTTWAHEEVEEEPDSNQFFRVGHLKGVLDLIRVPGIIH